MSTEATAVLDAIVAAETNAFVTTEGSADANVKIILALMGDYVDYVAWKYV